MAKNKVDNIVNQIPIDTKLYKFLIGSEGDIKAVEVDEMSNVIQNDELVANIVLSGYLKCWGIDVRTIARDKVDNTESAIVDLRNLLIDSKWEETNVIINGTTKTALEWIAEKFSIYDKADFIDELYRRIVDIVYNSDGDTEYSVLNTDNDTYQMIKLLAYCYYSDNDFSNVEVGEAEGINIPFDPSNIRNVEEIIYDILVEKGLIDSSISKASFALSSDIHHMFEDSPLNSDNFFKYFHFSYIQCPNGAWMACIYFTGEKVSTINFIGSFYNVYHGGQKVDALYTAIPIDMNGTPISDANLMGTWQKIGPTQYAFAPNLNEYDVFSGAMESRGACFCKRTNCDLIVDGNTIHYNEVRYDSTQGNNHYINTSIPEHWWHMPYGCSGDASLQITSRYFAESNKQTGTNVTWYTQGNPNYPWQGLPTTLPSAFTDSAEKHDVILNNILLGEQATVPSPTIDHLTLDDLDDRDLLNLNLIFMIYLDKDGIDAILKPTTTRIDIINILKTKIIDIARNVDIDDGIPLDEIIEDYQKIYTPYFTTTAIDYFNDGEYTLGLMPSELVGVLRGIEEVNNFNDELWDTDIWDALTHPNFSPPDCVHSIMTFPFDLIEGEDYDSAKRNTTLGGVAIDTQFHKLLNYIKVLETKPLFVGDIKKTTITSSGGKKITKTTIKDGNFLDYSPYSSATIYIPFVGTQDINLDLIMYRYIYIQYQVCILTGDFVATVYSYNFNDSLEKDAEYITEERRYKKAYPVLTCTGNMAISHAIAGRTQANVLGQLTNVISAVSGGISGNIGQVVQSGVNMLRNTEGQLVTKNSNLSGLIGWLDNWTPYLTLYKHDSITGFKNSKQSAFNETKGLKTERGIAIKNMDRGYHIVSGVKMQALGHATNQEKAEIEQILKTGFYTSLNKPFNHTN